MVEHTAVNRGVAGSSPARGAHGELQVHRLQFEIHFFKLKRPHGQAVKTSPFHGGNTSSNLVGVILKY